MRERRPEDFQVLCHVKYAGDVRLSLTAEILLDYPMPSFVGLPLKLNVTGITFDGVAVIAYIRKRVHFCFLSAEDADALIGSEQQQQESARDDHRPQSRPDSSASASQKRQGGLLQEIRVESEIGRKEDGKQVLKNVGKVERFVLAQVRRIFEEELVYPSFWTFLI
jgi:distribution and morphology protein 12